MRKSFVYAESPLLIGVVRRETPKAAIEDIQGCIARGATAIDLHLSCLLEEYRNEESIRTIVEKTSVPMLSLHYARNYDHSAYEVAEEERVRILFESVKAGASAIDMQGYTYDVASRDAYRGDMAYGFARLSPREVVTDPCVIERQCELIERVHAAGAEVVISTHPGVVMGCDDVVELALFLEKRGADLLKIVSLSETEDDLIEAMRTMTVLKKEVKTKVHFHVAGAAGKLSRLINPLLGGHMIFCSGEQHVGANKEQLDLTCAVAAIENIKKLIKVK